MKPPSERGPLIATVALNTAAVPDKGRLLGFCGENWPDSPAPSDWNESGHTVVFSLAGAAGLILLIPRPLPKAELDEACAQAWWWPQAAQGLDRHSAHLTVMLFAQTAKPLDGVMPLTRLTAALAATTDSAAVYWSETGVVHSPELFVQRVLEMRDGHLPVMLWISFQPFRNKKGQRAVFTSGMKSFGLMEIEVAGSERDPDEIMNYVLGVAWYLLEKGPVLNDGDSFGFSQDDRHPVTHGPSMVDREERVIQLAI